MDTKKQERLCSLNAILRYSVANGVLATMRALENDEPWILEYLRPFRDEEVKVSFRARINRDARSHKGGIAACL